MKRFLSIVSLVLFASLDLFAQKTQETSDSYTLSFDEVSLSDALKELNELSSEYKISFMYDELEDFRVSTRIVDKTIPEAVNQVIGFYPVSVSVKKDAGLTKIFVECIQKTDMRYKGRVLDSDNNPVAYANVVLFNAFGIPAFAVDTHVFRVSNRLGLCKAETVEETEKQMTRLIPKEKWGQAHHWLIWHGRRVCKAQRPQCETCGLRDLCAYANRKPASK